MVNKLCVCVCVSGGVGWATGPAAHFVLLIDVVHSDIIMPGAEYIYRKKAEACANDGALSI